jgi:hypothetical protein
MTRNIWQQHQHLQLRPNLPLNLNHGPPIRQHRLPSLNPHSKSNLLEPIRALLARPPHLRNQLVRRLDGRREPRLKLLHILRLARPKRLQDGMRTHVPREQAVDNWAAEAHFLAGFGVRVEGVVVAVEAVEMRGFHRGLVDACCVWCAIGWGWVVWYLGACDDVRMSVFYSVASGIASRKPLAGI